MKDFSIINGKDTTKVLKFDTSGIDSNKIITLKVPNESGKIALSGSAIPASMFDDGGDPNAPHFKIIDLILDGNVHQLNLSNIVPANATAVDVLFMIKSTEAQRLFWVGETGKTINYNVKRQYTQVPNISICGGGTIKLDANKKIAYKGANTNWIIVNIYIRGWWK